MSSIINTIAYIFVITDAIITKLINNIFTVTKTIAYIFVIIKCNWLCS